MNGLYEETFEKAGIFDLGLSLTISILVLFHANLKVYLGPTANQSEQWVLVKITKVRSYKNFKV